MRKPKTVSIIRALSNVRSDFQIKPRFSFCRAFTLFNTAVYSNIYLFFVKH